MQFDYGAITDVGRVRANNEDAVTVDTARGVAVLADGMGGYNAGEVASALAVDLVVGEMARWLDEAGEVAGARELRRAMEICVDTANRAIFDAANTHAAYAGMGTTLVMAVLREGMALIGHVGDSRAYRWRGGLLEQLTRDHSLLQEQIDIGLITPEEAAASGNRNLVTRALGVEDTVLLDLREVDLQDGDQLLLCSDGLNDLVRDEEMAQVLAGADAPDAKCQSLVDLANVRGGRDNVSVIIAQVRELPKKSGVVSKLLRK